MYDQAPTRDAYRTTRVPDVDLIRATTGVTAQLTKAVAVNMSYAHIFVKSEPINRSDPLFAGTPAVTTINTLSTNQGHANEIASSISLRF